MIELGGNITLVGFKSLDRQDLIIVKKMVGSAAAKLAEREGFENLSVTMKPIHQTTGEAKKFEMHGKTSINGKLHVSETVAFNLFVGIDDIIKKLENQM